ncbi:unnamed protein product [Closterium sp. NIES-54]
MRLLDEDDGIDGSVQECNSDVDLSERALFDGCDADEDAHRGLANGGRFLGGGVANSDDESEDAETGFVGLFEVESIVVVGAGYFDDVVVTVVAEAEGVLRARRPLAALVLASSPAFPPCCPTGRAPPSLPAMISLRRSGGSGDGSGGSNGSGGGRTSSRCGAFRWGVSGGGQMQLQRHPHETLTPQQLREWYAQRGASQSSARCPYVIRTGDRAGQTCGTVGHTQSRGFSCLSETWRAKFGNAAELPRWLELLRQGVDIFALGYDAILTAMYALTIGTEGDCSLCVLPDPDIEAAALGASEFALPSTAPAEASHTFTLDSCALSCFFRNGTTLTPLSAPVPIRLADPSGGPVLARSSTVLCVRQFRLAHCQVFTSPCSLRTCVSICTCTQTGRHLATFTRQPGSSLYTLATEPPQVAASAQVSASGPVAPPCSYRLLSHQTLLWHHRLGHPSLPRLRGMHSGILVSSLPRSLPPPQPLPAPPCLPCVEGRQRAAPHSSSFPPNIAPLQTLHRDVWGPARVSGQGRERYFLLVVDDFTRYTTVFPLRSKCDVPHVLIPWIRAVRLQLRERFREDLPVLRLHCDRGGEFSSDLLRDFCHGEGILQSFTLPASPQPNGIAERRIGLVMEPRVSLPETSPTLRWTGEVGDASVFRVLGCCVFVCDTSANKLYACAIPCVFLGFPPDMPGWQFYHPTLRRVLPSQDVTFDESVPFYRLFPYRSAPPPPLPLFLAPSPSPVDPLLGTAPVEVAVGSGAARGAASEGAASGGAERGGAESEGAGFGGAEPGGAEPGGAEPSGVEPGGSGPEGVEPGGAESEGAESGGAASRGTASSGGPLGTSPRLSPRPGPLYSQQLHEWFAQRTRLRSGAAGAGDSAARDTGAGGAGVTAGAGGTGGATAAGHGGARTRGTVVDGTGGVGGAGAGDPMEPGAAGAGGVGAGGTGAGGTGAGGAGAVDPGAGGAGAGGGTGGGGTVRPRPYFIPLLQQVLRVPSSTGLTPPLVCPLLDQSQPLLQPASPLPAPSPYTEQTSGLTKRREPASRHASPVRTSHRIPRPRPPRVPGTHAMALCPASVPLRAPLPPPPESSLPVVPDPESDRARAANPTVSRLLATVVTDPSFESTASSALVADLVDFAAACRLDYAIALVAESESASPLSVGGECALGMDVLEEKQEDFEFLAVAVPRFASMRLAPEGDPDAPDIPTPRSYAEAITGPYCSQWQAAMDAEMASWKSTGTYVDAVPPSRANIVDGMWIFRVKQPPGSPPAFKARYVARGFSHRQGVDYFQTFSPTLKMTTLRVLLHVVALRDYELHSLDFITTFLQGSLHEEIWLCRPPGFTGSFPASTQWSLRRPIYGLCQAPREWHDTLRTTLSALGFTPTADPSLILRTNTSLPPFYVLVYIDDIIFTTTDSEALNLVKSELQKRHTCSDLDELRSYLGLQITRDRAWRTITLNQSHMVHQVL